MRRWLLGLACFGLASGLAVGVGVWRHRITQPVYRLQRGQEALARGDLSTVEAMADRLESAGYPDHAHLLRGQMYLGLQRPNDAIREYNLIRQTNDEILAQASAIYGLAFLSAGDPHRAQKLFQAVANLRPDNIDARKGLAALYYDQGAMDLAVRQLERWAELDPEDGQPQRFLGRIYNELDEPQRAIENYQAALSLRLTSAVCEEVTMELAELLIAKQAFGEAFARLDGCSFERTDPETLVEVRAECLLGLGRHAEAMKLLEGIAQERSPSARRLRLEARLLSDAGDLNRAVDLLERALRLTPRDQACREQLARLYERLGRRAAADEQRRLLAESQKLYAAVHDLTRKANHRANDADARRQLAALFERLGKPAGVERWLRAAALCPPQDSVPDE
jgi:tetratricopeptide (TPR) repeat protein